MAVNGLFGADVQLRNYSLTLLIHVVSTDGVHGKTSCADWEGFHCGHVGQGHLLGKILVPVLYSIDRGSWPAAWNALPQPHLELFSSHLETYLYNYHFNNTL